VNLLSAASGGPAPADVPFKGELRHGLELARLLASREFLLARRAVATPPVMLIPGFMAGDPSLSVLRGWLAVNRDVYRLLAEILEEYRWTG
jgi:hypothetical protein